MPPDLALGRDVLGGRYTLLRVLGEGSQGATYEARDNGPGAARPSPENLVQDFQRYVKRAREGEAAPIVRGLVAIKCFRVDRAKAWKDVELAEREATTLASVSHPRLPRYVTHFEEDGALYLVMEKIEGESLASIRARGGTLAPGELARLLAEIGDALRYLHARTPPIVHRDIKPGNVIRRDDGSFALVDFGAVRDRLRPTGGSTVVGTFGYMAPEQFQGRASPRSDLYGLGATALAMLTGREPEELPHVGLGVDVEAAVRGAAPGTPRPMVAALRAMLQPDPDRRAVSIDEVLATLANAEERPAARDARVEPDARRARKLRAAARAAGRDAEAELRSKRREAKAAAREARRQARAARRARAWPLLPRVLARIGLSIAMLAVWLVVGMAVPLVLLVLSLLLGAPLLRAAKSCQDAGERSLGTMRRASRLVEGERAEGEIRVRVVDDANADADVDGEANAEPEEDALEDDREEAPPRARRARRTP